MRGRVGLGGDAVKRGTGGAEVGKWSGRKRLVSELLSHGANDGAEMLMILVGGIAEARENGVAEVIVGFGIERRLHLKAFHGHNRWIGSEEEEEEE